MKILYITQWFSMPEDPGLSRAYQFAKNWANAGHHVHVITSSLEHLSFGPKNIKKKNLRDKARKTENIEVKEVWTFPYGRRGVAQRICLSCSFFISGCFAALFGVHPDIIIATSPPVTVGLLGLMISRRYGIPFVYEMRDLWPDTLIAGNLIPEGILSRCISRIEQLLINRANFLITVSNGDKLSLIKRGIDNSLIHVIPHGVDNWMINVPNLTPKKSNGSFVSIYAGALNRYNHTQDIVYAAKFLSNNRRFRFIIYGDGDEKKNLNEIIKRECLENISIKSVISKKNVFHELVNADSCILVSGTHSQYKQWLPNKIFDYIASGTPVVASAQGELAELIKSGGGVVVRPGNPENLARGLLSLAALPESRLRSIGEKSRSIVLNRFSRSHQAGRLLEKFEELVVKHEKQL